ncbi:hypothetical protein Scep_016559 [Stephania cephalantha]|uniref:Uncharacterized protein n=1 Tax=Stephania cephalantha TaxID=152367 RepID=A0AAP0NW18_9MAGN
MSMNRKSKKGGPGTGMLLHNYGSISTMEHKRDLVDITWRMEEQFQTQKTPINENAVYLKVAKLVKGRVYTLGSQGHIRAISSHGSMHRPNENDLVDRGFKIVHEALLQEIRELQEENKELRDSYAPLET